MIFRKSEKSDITDIMKIINQAQKYLKENGIDQWQDDYPNFNTIENDIDNGIGYVLLENKEIIANVALSFDGEKTYDNIYDGKWLTNHEYLVIHRLAVKNEYKGSNVSKILMQNIENICLQKNIKSIKIDTHRNNLRMQNFLKKNDFKYCGIIYLEDKSERLAFEKILKYENKILC